MKKILMGFIGAMMILSLAACTPTMEKNKNQEVKQSSEVKKETSIPKETKAPVDRSKLSNGVAYERGNDFEAEEETVVMVYTVEDGKLIGNMDSVASEIMKNDSAQAIIDLMADYGVVEQGTRVIEYITEGEAVSAGPAGPGGENGISAKGTLNLNQLPEDGKNEMIVHAVARTVMECLNVKEITIKVNGETVAESLSELDVE